LLGGTSETVTGGTSGATGDTSEIKYWYMIDDAEHEPYLFNDIDTNLTEQNTVTLKRTFTAEKRISASVSADETFSIVGVQAGASVNDNDVRIKIAAPLTLRFSATTTPAIIDVSSFHASTTSISWDSAASEFVLTHGQCGLSAQCMATFENTAKDEYVGLMVRRVSANEHRISVVDRLEGTIEWDGSSWSITNREIARNGSESGYTVTGLGAGPNYFIDVTHPTTATEYDANDLTAEVIGTTNFYLVAKTNITRTGFSLQLRDPATGSVVSTLPSSLKIRFRRGWYKMPRPITGHIAVALPYTLCNPADIVSANANLWVIDDERY
jgi:hypothetical protein